MALRRNRDVNDQARGRPRLNRSNVKRYVSVATVVMPAVMPLLYQGAAAVRDRWDQARAQRLGVPADRLTEFTGKGATLHARLARLSGSLTELAERHPEHADFAETSQGRLADLAGAVRAAEQMPVSRRRAAHQAVRGELDAVEQDLLQRYEVA